MCKNNFAWWSKMLDRFPGRMSHKRIEIPSMIAKVISTARSRMALHDAQPTHITGPLFSFLVGAGFSVTAGMPSTALLVSALKEFKKNPGSTWVKIFENANKLSNEAINPNYDLMMKNKERLRPNINTVTVTGDYFKLMDELCPLPPARHHFITAAIQWASRRNQGFRINKESVLLASILSAGTGDKVEINKKIDREWLARAFARHVFTTNFDDVLLGTFFLGNKPVIIIDGIGRRAVTATAYNPTVVYLHGRHHHYDMKNTPSELKFYSDSDINGSGITHQFDLFDQFRHILRQTGLIVIGYSGAEDRIMDCIRDAINDPNSLPYGLWWSAKDEIDDLHPNVRSIIDNSDKAFYLAPGKDAEQIMKAICLKIGVDYDAVKNEWFKSTGDFMDKMKLDLRKYLADVKNAFQQSQKESAEKLIEDWGCTRKNEVDDLVLDKSNVDGINKRNNYDLAASITKAIADLLMFLNKFNEAEKAYTQAIEWHSENDDKLEEAFDCQGLGDAYRYQDKIENAENAYRRSLEIHKKDGDRLGKGNDFIGLAKVAVRKGNLNIAEKHYADALELYKEVNSRIGQANAFRGLAGVYLYKNKLNEAEKAYEEARERHKEFGEKNKQYLNYENGYKKEDDNKSKIKYDFWDNLTANDVFGKAMVLLKKISTSGEYMSGKYLHKEIKLYEIENIKNLFASAMEMHKANNNDFRMAMDKCGYAELLILENDLAGAAEQYEETLKTHKTVKSNYGTAYALMGLCSLELKKENFEECKKRIDELAGLLNDVSDVNLSLNVARLKNLYQMNRYHDKSSPSLKADAEKGLNDILEKALDMQFYLLSKEILIDMINHKIRRSDNVKIILSRFEEKKDDKCSIEIDIKNELEALNSLGL